MTKRFIVIDDGFDKYIEDTSLTEDKHEGNLYGSYDACKKLNEQNQTIQLLTDEIKILRNILYINAPREFSCKILEQSNNRIGDLE